MPKVTLGLFGIVLVFFVAAWLGAKYPSVNLLSKVPGLS